MLTLDQMDSTTQSDIETLSNPEILPCGPDSAGSLKCEACLGGCQSPATAVNMTNELTHVSEGVGKGGQGSSRTRKRSVRLFSLLEREACLGFSNILAFWRTFRR